MSEYDYLFEDTMKMADLQDIAAMDRLAAELQPPSVLRRWASRRAAERATRRGLRRRATLPPLTRRDRARHAA